MARSTPASSGVDANRAPNSCKARVERGFRARDVLDQLRGAQRRDELDVLLPQIGAAIKRSGVAIHLGKFRLGEPRTSRPRGVQGAAHRPRAENSSGADRRSEVLWLPPIRPRAGRDHIANPTGTARVRRATGPASEAARANRFGVPARHEGQNSHWEVAAPDWRQKIQETPRRRSKAKPRARVCAIAAERARRPEGEPQARLRRAAREGNSQSERKDPTAPGRCLRQTKPPSPGPAAS